MDGDVTAARTATEWPGSTKMCPEMMWPVAVTAGEVTYPPGGALGPRRQRDVQLVVLHSGAMTVWVDGALRTAAARSVSLLLPGHEERFAFAADRPTRHSWVQAHVPALAPEVEARLRALPLALPLSPAMADLERLVLGHAGTATDPLALALAASMVWRYVAEGEARSVAPPGPVEQARRFIHDHLAEPLSLRAIAAAAGVVPAHLSRLFRARLGTTPMAYVWSRRVDAGVELLVGTGLPVGVIAARCGFQTSFHFSRRVRRATGLAPTEVRRRAWEG
jgi:AraC family transcriptional regulator of arabinose operon